MNALYEGVLAHQDPSQVAGLPRFFKTEKGILKKHGKRLFSPLLILMALLLTACGKTEDESSIDYRQAMRDFVIRISETARTQNADFIVIPQNGIPLVTMGEDADSELSLAYLAAIDGHGQEELFYGYDDDDEPTPASETEWLLAYLRRSHTSGKKHLSH